MTILDDVKNGIGLGLTNDGFDPELLMYVNSIGAELSQIGVAEFDIEIDDGTEWPALATQELTNLVKEYLPLSTKLVFDSSASETISKAFQNRKVVLEGRISLIVEEQAAAVP